MTRCRLALLALCLALSACGFHAAGKRPLPPGLERVHVDTVEKYQVAEPQVEKRLRSLLAQRGATVLDRQHRDAAQIRLTRVRESRQVRTVGADGKALEYDLIIRVEYQVRRGDTVPVPTAEVEVRRDYSFNPGQLLAKEQEALRLRDYLEDEAAELILLRVEAAMSRAAAQETLRDVPPARPRLKLDPELSSLPDA